MLLKEDGVGLLPFALHGNVKDEKVWGIVDLAKENGFQAQILEAKQLTPQSRNMDINRLL